MFQKQINRPETIYTHYNSIVRRFPEEHSKIPENLCPLISLSAAPLFSNLKHGIMTIPSIATTVFLLQKSFLSGNISYYPDMKFHTVGMICLRMLKV